MRLTKSEMNLEGLEDSPAYDGAMIGEVLLFQANTNIPHEQSVPLIQEVVRRCNCHDQLLEACKHSPAPNFFADFANFAEECSEKRSMAIYKGRFLALTTFLRSCVDRSEKMLAALAAVKGD